MTDLSDYSLALLRSSKLRLYRGTSTTSGPALFVRPEGNDADSEASRRLHHEYELRAELSAPWALRPIALLHDNGQPLLMLEDPGGDLLRKSCDEPMTVDRFLPLAIEISKALSAVHARGIVHCDLNPNNILETHAERGVRLTGFGCAFRDTPEHRQGDLHYSNYGTLEYMAPELCGQMNCPVDNRADLYSLGCTFYEMLTHSLPMGGSDRLALVHAHLARSPALPSELVRGIPRQLEMIVMKLLSKDPEERYQSAASLAADLERCTATRAGGDRVALFPLDMPALPGRQRVSPRLYGRDDETKVLHAAFERCAMGKPAEMILVSGYSGAGKSSLVKQWISQRVTSPHLFAAGTCEQVNSATPYTALFQIIEKLVRPILGQDEETFLASQRRLLDALGNKARALWTTVPDLKLVLGDQLGPDDSALPVDRAQFLKAAADLIKAFCTPECPLILFFDDLHWADEGTISALAYFNKLADTPYLLLIGAYRSNEVRADHPLLQLTEAPGCNHLQLSPLNRDDTALLVASTLGCSLEQASPVVDLVKTKTGGNPFFVTQFSIELAQEGLIEFEHHSTLQVRDIDRIRTKAYTDNVVDLMLRRFDRLSPATQGALRHFSCLGSVAAVQALAKAMDCAPTELDAAFAEASAADLVYRNGDAYHFRHDRFREAAYGSMDVAGRVAMHLDIGRRMVARIVDDDTCEDIYEIVSQIDLGSHAVTSESERRRFANLNVVAAKRAKTATAYASALTYLVAAAEFLRAEPDDNATQWIEFWRADCECLIGKLEPAKQRLAALAARDISMALRAEMTRLATGLHTAQNRPDLGIEAGLDFLHRLGLELEFKPTDAQVDESFARFVQRIGERSIADLGAIPMISDPLWRSAIDVLADLIPPALFIDANLVDMILLHVGKLSVEHGLCDSSAFGFVFLNFVFGVRYHDYRKGYEFGKLAVQLVDRCGPSRYASRIYMRFGTLVIPWFRPLGEGAPFVEQAYKISAEIGNLVFDVSSARNVSSLLMLAGAPLEDVYREAEKGVAIARASKFGLYLNVLGTQLDLVNALRETGMKLDDDGTVSAGAFNTDLISASPHNTTSVAFSQWSYRLQAACIFGEVVVALEAEQMCMLSLRASKSILEVIDFRFYSALNRAAACVASDTDSETRTAHHASLQDHFSELSVLAQACPANFAGRHALVGALIAQLEGNVTLARQRFEEAIQHAESNRFLQVEALANERAAAFCAELGLEQNARTHLRAARNAYAQWGARAKVDELNHRHGLLRDTQSPAIPRQADEFPYQQLDVAAIIKASGALASEIVLSNLIETLVTTVVQHAGAQRCILALPHGPSLRIEAEAQVRPAGIDVRMATAEMSPTDLAVSVVHAVVRTGKHIVLDNAFESGPFVRDEYVKRNRSRSIVCTPLIKQTKLVGVLYMENDLAVGAFTADKIAILTLLGGQAAISLENARLYEDLIEQNRARAEAEEALRNALANLARVTRLTTMGELVASIVHEVSQPLMAIQTSSGAALRWLNRDAPNIAEAKDMISNAVADSIRASKVIQGLRAMAKQSEPVIAVFDLSTAVFEVLAMLRGQIQDHDVEVINQSETELLVKGDRVQIQQVVMNLVVNATEAMATIDDRPRLLKLSCAAVNESRIRVSVTDTGPGLDAEVAHRIFEPFVTTKASGMGMGLSISNSIIEAHHGQLSVEAGKPFGTVFSFTLPVAEHVEDSGNS
ncbi:AAA family ATPase [Paraburkholderia sp. DHOC27]|uniref:trifunctional serine/threonine-protein kinase/ATP-binding protein/sensor histidine kinase n=1 Tax=Paraburkholderia sp. DHOC27 TaxID=2303330 RepID=UPI000E3C5A49|nr:AAA family ATPase [Paraburkholderia sp. DHOC27]RFU49074.1 GAF domain-containing protein [Paraburkholderia sp. DHOC27]